MNQADAQNELNIDFTRRTVNNAVTSIIGWIWPIALNLATLPYIIKTLGENSFGIFALILTVIGYFSFVNLGLNTASVKYVAEYWTSRDHDKLNHIVGSMLVIYAALGLLVGLSICLAADWLARNVLRAPPELIEATKTALRIGALGFWANMIGATFAAVPRALQRFEVANAVTIGITTLSTLSTIVVLAAGGGLVHIVSARCAVSILAIVVFVWVARRLIPFLRVRFRYDGSAWRELLSFGGLAAINQVASQAILQLDRVFVSSFLGPAAVTYYEVPSRLTSQAHTFISSGTSVLLPLSSELATRGEKDRLREIYARGIKYVNVLATMVYLPLGLLAPHLLRFWVGDRFSEQSGLTLSVLVLSFYALSFNIIPYHILNGLGQPLVNTLSALIGGAINIGACLILIPRMGILGAAVANLLGMIRIPVYLLYINRYVFKINSLALFSKSYLKPWLIAGMIAVLFFLVGVSPSTIYDLLSILLALVLVYVLMTLLLGVFDAQDKKQALHYVHGLFQSITKRYSDSRQ